MMRLEPEQMEVLRQAFRARFPEHLLEGLRQQGLAVERETETGQLVVQEAAGGQTRVAFHPDGLPARLESPSGDTFGFEHDEQGRLSALHYPHGERLELEHDSQGNLTALRRPGLPPHTFEYDEQQRLLSVTYPDGSRMRFAYHAQGPLERVEDRLGATTHQERDEAGRLRARVDALGRRTVYEADEQGRLAAVVFADGSRQAFSFNPESRTTTAVLRDGSRVVHERDETDTRHALTWADGKRTELELTGGGVSAASNAWGRVQFTLDGAGNPLSEETPWGRVLCAYDEQGRLSRLVTPRGEVLEYGYDADGRVCRVRDWERRETQVVYGPGGHVAEIRYGNGMVELRQHARAGRLARARVQDRTLRVVSEQRYGYDACERLVAVEDAWGALPEQRSARGFRYDAECRLLEELDKATGSPMHVWQYDRQGNLTSEDGVPVRVGLLDELRAWGTAPLEYDGNGNAVRLPGPRGELRCSWGGEGLLHQVQVGGGTVGYEYDALGRRVVKREGDTTWRYGWAGHQLLWEEVRRGPEDRPVRRDYLFFPGTMVPLAFREQGRTYWLQTDARGAVVRVFDEAGRVVWRARYDSFGQAHVEVAEVRQPWRLAGQYEDEETGLHYNLARYYCPWLKSYLSRDPRWYEPEATAYSYARNDPWNRADVFGGLAPLLAVGIAGLVGGVVGAITAAVTGGDPLAGAVEGAIVGAGGALAVVAGAAAGVVLAAGVVASGVGAVAGQLVEQARKGDGFCLVCAVKAGLMAAAIDLALLGLGKIPGVKSLVKALGSRLLGAGRWLAETLAPLLSRVAGKVMAAARTLATRVRNLLPEPKCTKVGHPVDVATGRVFTDAMDWELPGPLPLRFKRGYSSSRCEQDSALGYGWSHSLDLAVWEESGCVIFRAEDGREIVFELSHLPRQVLQIGQEVWEPVDRLTLRRRGERHWEVESAEGLIHELRALAGASRSAPCRVVRTINRAGHSLLYEYDGHCRLRWVTDSAGRRILFEHDARGRLVRVALPHTYEEGWVTHTRYSYSEAGDLVAVQDALGHVTRYEYRGHLLTRETDRTGLSFYFEYDGEGQQAWCVRTWGDGGIHEHSLKYDKQARVTTVTNSLGHTTLYFANEWGAVVKEVDPLGGERRYAFDEFMYKVAEVDPLGQVTRHAYDARGNCTRVEASDGTCVTLVYNAFNQPVRATDAIGGKWAWCYDSAGLLMEELNPLEERRQYEYEKGLLSAVVGPLGERTELDYDAQGNLTALRAPTGARVHWRHDRLGRPIEERGARGASWRLRYDVLGRPMRLENPAGEVWERRYDQEGNLKEVKGPLRRIRFFHTGFHKMAGWEENGARVSLSHDTEGQLVAVTNEAGETFRLMRDACGRVTCEQGFDEALRHYQYDAAGRLVHVTYPSLRTEIFSYDAQGRPVEVRRSDGTFSRYRYRADGALLEAENENGKVTLERDALGRVVRERQGQVEITSRYSPAGQRVEMSSTLGARQELVHGMLGEVLGVHYTSHARSAPWSMAFERDAEGRELSRRMPGGVVARWQYDEAGRPLMRSTLVDDREVARRTWRWRGEDQIAAILDKVQGPTEFFHDSRGRLVGARLPDGRIQHRAMDVVGNLFRRPDLSDRRYGRGGNLLEAEGTRSVYDADGRLVEKHEPGGQTWCYRWSGAGLLREVQRPDGACIRFSYDALARRTSKALVRVDSQGVEQIEHQVHFVWDAAVPLHEVDSSEGMTTWLFESDSFTPLAKEDQTGCYALVADHLGTPTEVYDELGRLAWRMQLDIFGGARADVARTHCPWRWPGQYEDEETGLYYNGLRYYDKSAGVYLSQDPAGLTGGLRTYGYVLDPLNSQDPLGLMPLSLAPIRGHHLVPHKLATDIGLKPFNKEFGVPSYYFSPGSPADAHNLMHGYAPLTGGPANKLSDYQGKKLTPEEWIKSLQEHYQRPEIQHLRGDVALATSNGPGKILASNVSPAEAWEDAMKWGREQPC
ncbi:RHS repeat-associated core domain-containing protein [Archangium sp.]|uniref:RHS repeat-associated core domain-containing protein n=1 Tax=Archangium sp. TaxID=1872627 RepID=UPI002D4C5044|nr:RHS repeat-associated core domain-containing protein [Archangium sp.]HYO53043.1 RHS repeat-associated core domain-containing protein [Archangium sp.]